MRASLSVQPRSLYTDRVLRYAITDGSRFPAAARIPTLLADAHRWATDALDFVQLREKSMPPAALLTLATAMLEIFRNAGAPTRLLINVRADIALAARAEGVHLTSNPNELTPAQVRHLYAQAHLPTPTISLSCHTLTHVHRARLSAPDLILLAPIFEKRLNGQMATPGAGLETLRLASQAAASIPILALGGIMAENIQSCIEAGAAGVAGIRLWGSMNQGR